MKFWDERSERLDRERLRYLQEEALRQMVGYVYEESEFYRRRFDEGGIAPGDIRTLEDFRQRIPLTTKEDLRLSQERMVRASRPPYAELLCCADDQVILTIATSGTTGAPTVIPLTRRDASMYHLGELGRRGFVSAGVGPGDVVASAFNLASEAGASNPDIRSRIEREWAADVFDMYGMVEMGYCGNECVEKRGLHLPEDWFFFETVDIDTQEPTPAGERGILAITHLRRQAMPILRYRIDDIITIRVEYDPRSTGGVEALRRGLQRDLTNTFFFAPKLELIPEGSLARFSMKAMRVIDLRRMGAKEKFDLTVRMQKLLE